MAGFPQTPYFIGLNEPVGQEVAFTGLEVEGTIPAEIRGGFYRAVPDPAFPPKFADDHTLSGDGMVSRLSINADGSVDFAMKFVETARHKAEKALGRARFGKYRNPYTDDADVQGVDRTVANTTPVWHAGKLLMAKEDGLPYRVDPRTLDTIGSYDFGGKLKSLTSTAHARIDPETGKVKGPSIYSEMVWNARQLRAQAGLKPIDWIVVRNRLGAQQMHNKRKVGAALEQLSKRIGFRVAPGFSERVIFRELFPRGLTLLDLRDTGVDQLNISNIAARQEVRDLVRELNLPGVTPDF